MNRNTILRLKSLSVAAENDLTHGSRISPRYSDLTAVATTDHPWIIQLKPGLHFLYSWVFPPYEIGPIIVRS
ncbi:hypothetical protein CEXT_653461 [Caerostris extrusa]|uniref:Uncharacterized protein n=1 Tax=Caerostris extrusa TaxID=172846 RepID=A0AAV4WN91_CAEEX|nr:hypothetical protein CEXT_653461 [Caerostris extrusa]